MKILGGQGVDHQPNFGTKHIPDNILSIISTGEQRLSTDILYAVLFLSIATVDFGLSRVWNKAFQEHPGGVQGGGFLVMGASWQQAVGQRFHEKIVLPWNVVCAVVPSIRDAGLHLSV